MMYCYSTDLNVYTWVELIKIGKFSEFSSLRNPYYHDKDRSLLKAGLASETLQEMVSTRLEIQYA